MKKAKLQVKTSSMALVLKIMIDFIDHCNEESQKAIVDILKFFEHRVEKPYHFMTEDQLTVIWNILNTGFKEELFALNDGEYKAVMTTYMDIATLLDNKDGKEWRDFTLTQNSPTSSPMSEVSQEK